MQHKGNPKHLQLSSYPITASYLNQDVFGNAVNVFRY